MATKAIGTGTRNICYNAPTDEHGLVASMTQAGETMADALRRLVLKGIEAENAAKAVELKNIRRRYYGVMNCTLALLSLSALLTGVDMRRPTRTARSSSSAIRTARTRKETC